LLVTGRVDLRGRELQLRAVEIRPLRGGSGSQPEEELGPADPVVVEVPAANCTSGMLAKLKETLAAHPGRAPVHMRLVGEGKVTPLRLGEGFRVDPSAGLLSELRMLLGPRSVHIEREPAGAGR
jgi:DNA polymerase-3 subunit alpha